MIGGDLALGNENYAQGSVNLEARAALWAYADPTAPEEPADWFLDLVTWTSGSHALDAGCGSGRFSGSLAARASRVVAFDYSEAMALEVASSHPTVIADVCSMPFATGSFDVVLAAWMLYHARDIDAACRELRRVVAPGGALVAVTNGARHTAELETILSAAADRLDAEATMPSLGANRFRIDDAAYFLSRWFSNVAAHLRTRRVLAPAGAVVAYLTSLDLEGSCVRNGTAVPLDELLEAIGAVAEDLVAEHGSIAITGLSAAFVCRD